MKRFLVLFLLMGVMAQAKASFPAAVDATACTQEFFQAMLEENNDQLSNLMTSDFSIISMNGQHVDRETLLQAIAQGYVTIDSGMLSALQTKNLNNVGVVTGSWRVKASIENNNYMGELSFMTVCVQEAGKWKVSAVQLTPSR
ncbi:uncharacterized protein DUF4440 [Dyadobacter jejuensis]|uniref:Uncharacterized protein DUF4440 n=1 Tax=Dyadobacter jejuensis TaxID=1082580 RepID=A0A316AI66_9BACT|nr:nuclear transport factor 2 family protein [Dyadobacter jejuensis]PWJ56654.1 uncharacterized protein DUF4440 [Dyadobacter jejuensis]